MVTSTKCLAEFEGHNTMTLMRLEPGTPLSRAKGSNIVRKTFEPQHEISNNVVCGTSKGSDQPEHIIIIRPV